jgi:biotin transport system substrate-specific component
MAKPAIQTFDAERARVPEASKQVALVVGAQACLWRFALALRFLYCHFTPVPLTVQNLGVLLVGLLLGKRRGFAALALYLAEGAVGMPVFQSDRTWRNRAVAWPHGRIL